MSGPLVHLPALHGVQERLRDVLLVSFSRRNESSATVIPSARSGSDPSGSSATHVRFAIQQEIFA